MPVRHSVGSVIALAGFAITLAASADDGLAPSVAPPPSADVAIALSEGGLAAPAGSRGWSVVASREVRVPGAIWLRAWFDGTRLAGDPAGDGAFIRITGLADGATQTLNADQLASWSFSSAYFNGEAIRVEVVAHAGAPASRLAIPRVTAGEDGPLFSPRTICDAADDRQLSSDQRSARLLPAGCTGWLIDDANRQFLSAGHCGTTGATVVQFNVPLSTSTGGLVNPAPEHQYPVDGASVQFVNSGPGNDYAYFGAFPNTTTNLTAFQAQGATYRLAPPTPPVIAGQSIRITGYGTVSGSVPRTWNQVQKTHAGPIASLTGAALRYRTDTSGGNSGSGVEDESTGLAVAIHTHGGCSSTGGSNIGTSLHLAAFRTVLANPQSICASGIGTPTPPVYISADRNNSFGTLNRTSGRFASVARFATPMQGLAFDPRARRFLGTSVRGAGASIVTSLHWIDPDTGATIDLGPITGVAGAINALAFDPGTRRLFGVVQSGGQLVRIDTDSLVATPVGGPFGRNVGAADFDPVSGSIFAIDDAAGGSILASINPATGAIAFIGPLGPGIADCNGLGIDPSDGALITINATTGALLAVNRATGLASSIGASGGVFGPGFGIAVAAPGTFCAADVNLDGGVTIDDLTAFLTWFEAGDLRADLDDGSLTFRRDAGVTLDDLFAMLHALLEGC